MEREFLQSALSPAGNLHVSTRKANSLSPTFQVSQQTVWTSPGMGNGWHTSTYPEGNLWRSKADGSERLQLTFAHMQVLLPRWSPDQKQIVFTGFVPGKPGRNYLISANGGTPQPVIPEEQTTDEEDPNWSPDGASIVFWFNGAINILDLRTHKVSVVPGSTGFFSPHWSPDGRYIVAMSGDSRELSAL